MKPPCSRLKASITNTTDETITEACFFFKTNNQRCLTSLSSLGSSFPPERGVCSSHWTSENTGFEHHRVARWDLTVCTNFSHTRRKRRQLTVVLRFIWPSLFQLLHLKLFEISRGNLIAWHKCLHKDFNPNSKNSGQNFTENVNFADIQMFCRSTIWLLSEIRSSRRRYRVSYSFVLRLFS